MTTTTPSEQTGTKPTNTLNGAFTFQGEKAFEIGEEFFDWCKTMEEKYGVHIYTHRVDYNSPRLK